MTLEPETDVLALREKHSAITVDSQNSHLQPVHLPSLETPYFLMKIYHGNEPHATISPKMTRKAVNWLLSIAWSKDYSLETGWTALMLFYGYKAQREVKKQQLEMLRTYCDM